MTALLHHPLARFIAQAIAVIGLSRLLGLAARRVRQPMVVAEIAAGIALGPSLLGWAAPQVKEALFPAESLGLLGVVSQVGLILFMFLVGLELDPKLLQGRVRSSALISQSSILVPFGLGGLLALYLYPRLAPPSVPFAAFALFLGVSMSITAFPVLARILVERRLLRTRVGAITIASAAVADVTAWCVLAFVIAVARSSGLAGAAVTTALALGYIGVMFAVVRPLLRRLADRTATKEGLSQHVVAALLVAVLVSSWITDLIGIHALFGAFVVGAIMPKEGGLARALAERLEDLVVILFLPLLFAYSGLRTEIGLLRTWGDWGMCLLLVAVACAGKLAGSMGAARATGLSWRESGALGILMNTRGLIELVVLNIGLDLGVISPALFAMMVIMALVTTFMTTPALEWVYPLSELSKDLIEAAPAHVTPRPAPGYTVLACVSFERSGPAMATVAAALLGTEEQNRFYALQLVPVADRASFLLDQQRPADDGAALRPLVERAEELNVKVRPLSFTSAHPAEDICQVAGVKRASLVLLGWHKPLIGKAALGGTVHEVMSRAASDVGVLVDRGLGQIERILVPYLGSAHDRAALAAARRILDHTGASVTVLHVVSPSRAGKLGAGSQVEEVFHEEAGGLPAQVVFKAVEDASPVNAVLAESERGYDLVVIGGGPEWGLEHRLFGMQAEVILSKCRTSLLVVRQGSAAAERVPAASDERLPAAGVAVETS